MLTLLAVAITSTLVPVTAHAQPGWDDVEQIVQEEVDSGFSGTVLLVRDGEVVLDKGYGLADRDQKVPNTPKTIFALGSTPIDFTHVAILQLLHHALVQDALLLLLGHAPAGYFIPVYLGAQCVRGLASEC